MGAILGVGMVMACVGCLARAPESEPAAREAAELLAEVRARMYSTWDAPQAERFESRGPHGPWTVVYVSAQIASQAEGVVGPEEMEPERWPTGSMAVSESYAEPSAAEPMLVQMAVRDEEGWRWAQYDEEDQSLAYGLVGTCLSCHVAGDDFLLSVSLPRR